MFASATMGPSVINSHTNKTVNIDKCTCIASKFIQLDCADLAGGLWVPYCLRCLLAIPPSMLMNQ